MAEMTDSKTKILHVEDDENVSFLVRVALEKGGYEVLSACDAAQGLKMAGESRPDLVVLDVMMPGGGAGLYESFRRLDADVPVPILIYSGTDRAELAKKIPLGPRTEILVKPATSSEFRAVVARLLESKAA
jgi:DNA-binding response OmpR family regulator